MRDSLWISLGAIAGANLRYLLGRLSIRFLDSSFPYATLFINVTGSLILGFFLTWTAERVLVTDQKWRMLIAIGFCGAYTTFSSYAFETMAFFQQGQWWPFTANILSNNVLCLAGVLAGAALARW